MDHPGRDVPEADRDAVAVARLAQREHLAPALRGLVPVVVDGIYLSEKAERVDARSVRRGVDARASRWRGPDGSIMNVLHQGGRRRAAWNAPL